MPKNDSDTDGRIGTGRPAAAGDAVVCPACGRSSTDSDRCEHCGRRLRTSLVESYAGP